MIKIEKLNKKYNDKVIFKDFNAQINKGDFVLIHGESGAGKSTLLNIIGMLDDEYEGEVTILGKENPDIAEEGLELLRNDISYLFQNYGLIDNESIYYNFNIINRVRKSKDKEKQMKSVLKILGLEHLDLKEKIYVLSGGEQQRIAVGKILLKRPKIILCDEPTGSLDKENAMHIIELLKELNEKGTTILVVSHDMIFEEYVNKKIEI